MLLPLLIGLGGDAPPTTHQEWGDAPLANNQDGGNAPPQESTKHTRLLLFGTPLSGGQGSDSKNTNDTKEILRYLAALTDEDRETLLETLCGSPDDVKGRAGDTSTKPTSFDDYMQMADTRDEEV